MDLPSRLIDSGGMFESMRVFQAAELLDSVVLELIKRIPKGFGKDIDQLTRALGSILFNIAEAVGIEQMGKKIYHLEAAKGSADEVRAILRRFVRRGALSQKEIQRPSALTRTIAKMLAAWIATLHQSAEPVR
ncbi:MAG: four helix bundle protein [Gemmatimonadota bacterium]